MVNRGIKGASDSVRCAFVTIHDSRFTIHHSRVVQTSICAPSSTTRLGGIWKNSVAERALRDMSANRRFRHRDILARPVSTSRSRPRKYEVSTGGLGHPGGG